MLPSQSHSQNDTNSFSFSCREKKAKELEANWQNRLRSEGQDEESKEKMVQDTKREIESIEHQLVSFDERVKEGAEKILEQQKVVSRNDPKIARAVESLAGLRLDIEAIKGPKMYEDENFDIDNSRDERGHTFLMVASQNNDFQTAQICLALGADPYAINPDRFQAIDYSFFWGFDDITNMILKVRATSSASTNVLSLAHRLLIDATATYRTAGACHRNCVLRSVG